MGWLRRKPKTFRTDLPPIDSTPAYRAVFRKIEDDAKRPLVPVSERILVEEQPAVPLRKNHWGVVRAWLHEPLGFRELSREVYDGIIKARGETRGPFPAAVFRVLGEQKVYFALTWRALAGRGGLHSVVGDQGEERLEKDPEGTHWIS